MKELLEKYLDQSVQLDYGRGQELHQIVYVDAEVVTFCIYRPPAKHYKGGPDTTMLRHLAISTVVWCQEEDGERPLFKVLPSGAIAAGAPKDSGGPQIGLGIGVIAPFD